MVWLGGGKGFFFPLLELISMGASLQSLSEEVCGPKGCLFFFVLFCFVCFFGLESSMREGKEEGSFSSELMFVYPKNDEKTSHPLWENVNFSYLSLWDCLDNLLKTICGKKTNLKFGGLFGLFRIKYESFETCSPFFRSTLKTISLTI